MLPLLQLHLCATASVGKEHAAAVPTISVGADECPWSAAVNEALAEKRVVVVDEPERKFGPLPGARRSCVARTYL